MKFELFMAIFCLIMMVVSVAMICVCYQMGETTALYLNAINVISYFCLAATNFRNMDD